MDVFSSGDDTQPLHVTGAITLDKSPDEYQAQDLSSHGLLSQTETESLFNDFKTSWVLKFPFIVLSHEQTASHAQKHNPFLFLCILGVTIDFAHPRHEQIQDQVMDQITSRIIRNAERNTDLLQGLLVYTAWYRYPSHGVMRELLLLLQLCATLVFDLNLEKTAALTMDEKRAILGTYWLSIGLGRTLGKPVGLMYADCIGELSRDVASTSAVCASNSWAGNLALLQTLISRVDESLLATKKSSESTGSEGLPQILSALFSRELENLKTSLSMVSDVAVPIQRVLSLEIQVAELAIRETCLSGSRWPRQTSGSTYDAAIITRTKMLWEYVKRSRSLIESFLSTPDAEFWQSSFVTISRIRRTFETMADAVWTLFEIIENGYEEQSPSRQEEFRKVIKEADALRLIAEIRRKLERVTQNVPAEKKEFEFYSMCHAKFKMCAACYQHRTKDLGGIDAWDLGEEVAAVEETSLWDGGGGMLEDIADLVAAPEGTIWGEEWWSYTNHGVAGNGRYGRF
ncbi:hypothetical protein FZEAL_4577 [Fusarium zealandicum]|uniref:Transcription factor n=1 Tax=Fusarium zealandicum TaxID=1053134 RepID=A0A8H4XKN3_9HYPO|nr:hypothetical protein FZEAL_4577 [Fusarium zealandicum]